MIPSVGSTCKFTFTQNFASLDGIYRVIATSTFKDSVSSGVDFIEKLYTPAGLSATDFNNDYVTYLSDRVVILESVIDASIVYYVPETVFLGVPDPTIREYYPLVLIVNLGVQKNTQRVLPVMDSITDIVRSSIGSTDPVRLITSEQNKSYLTDTEYQILEDARAANIEELVPLSVQLKQEQDKNVYLAARVAALEALIIDLGG